MRIACYSSGTLALRCSGMLRKTTINIHTDDVNLYQGDCLSMLSMMEDSSVDLIVTSPPYADQRKGTYGGISPDQYVDWFAPVAEQLLRVLKPSGSFILNIKEKAVNGERHTYVLELILKMRELGWLWTEEYIWHKKNSFPGKWPNRFRDSWERCLHFTKSKKFAMYQEAVMVPMGDWKNERLKKLSARDTIRDESRVGSGFGKNISNWKDRDMAYPTNVLHMATECGNKSHSAAFPESLPEWFIRLFTTEGDVVLDPFAGSGTTLLVAERLARKTVGFELLEEHCLVAKERLGLKKKRLGGVISYSKNAE
ncbi:site-specific DNA-methyltransferase [Salmonella enterica]|nr:site-specific DNA-methyltransferase [Salmonella enterica]ELF9346617.1 site-specific DNA-methyltransferase [Salmonella enterica]